MKLGHLPAARADQEQTGVVMRLLIAGDELVGAPDLVRKPLVDQKIERTVDGGRGRTRMLCLHLFEQVIRLNAPGLASQQAQDVAANRGEACAVFLAAGRGLIKKGLFVCRGGR